MKISTRAVDFIIAEEVISPAYYEKHYQHPIWPRGDSGITIGVGYDLGYVNKFQIALDWKKLSLNDIELLQSVGGIHGERSIGYLSEVKNVSVPFDIAKQVFVTASLPKYAAAALRIYPGLDKLLPDAVGGVVSMVYNRGASLEGARRIHMRKIVPLVAAMDYAGIAEQIAASAIIWQGKHLDGLIERREKEAALVRNAIHGYSEVDLIEI